LQSFEAKYFDLIKLHRENVSELALASTTGRRVFVLMFRELRAAATIVRRIAQECEQRLLPKEVLHIAYYCLYFGTGPTSSRMLKISLLGFSPRFIDALDAELSNPGVRKTIQGECVLDYTPFEGHQSRLGHYYRHLYQAVRYVDEQTIQIRKYDYVKTLRAQLTNHEQALLLVNSLSEIGKGWWDKEFIQRYRMVQNIPRDFFDVDELDVLSLPLGDRYFEWQEIQSPGVMQPTDARAAKGAPPSNSPASDK
jgi:hypothetical protein